MDRSFRNKVSGQVDVGQSTDQGSGEEVRVSDGESRELLCAILAELKTINFHLGYMSDLDGINPGFEGS